MRSSYEGQPLVGRSAFHADHHGFAAVAGTDTVPDEERPERLAADASDFSQRLLGLPGEVTLDQVVSVRRVEWSGHVYNLSTATGAYSGNGIIVHNCRCHLTLTRHFERQT